MESTVDCTWTQVCALDDMISHVGVCALHQDRQIAIFYFKDEHRLYAIDNFDPISGVNVLSRGLVGDLQGQIVVASPLYKQHYNLETGQCLEQADISVSCYPVREHDGIVELGTL
jgi:NAD(P)H-dependent nitrite reductase small subunit